MTGIPLTIGITGHRNLREEDFPSLRISLQYIFKKLRKQYPSTTLRLLSPLAAGADRLAAEAAIEEGIELIVPLPMPKAEYEKDFTGSLDEFNALLGRSTHSFELALAPGNTNKGIQKAGAERDLQYRQVGAYICQHCHILVALWDGLSSERLGGTDEVVGFKLKGIPVEFLVNSSILDEPDTGPVYHIMTSRKGNQGISNVGSVRLLYPENQGEQHFNQTLKNIEHFNQEAAIFQARFPEKVKQSREWLLPPQVLLSSADSDILNAYAVADSLSIHFKIKSTRAIWWLFALATTMVVTFQVYANLMQEVGLLAIYPILFLCMGLVRWHQQKHNYHDQFLDYRALAEGLRVQLFWRLAGVPAQAADHYLRRQCQSLLWIREALRVLSIVPYTDQKKTEMVFKHWVDDQAAYYAKATKRDETMLGKLNRKANMLYLVGFITSLVVVGMNYLLINGTTSHHLFLTLSGLTPAIAAIWMGYAGNMAFSEQIRQYSFNAELFGRANSFITQLTKEGTLAVRSEEVSALLFDLGKESLAENADWIHMHHIRPVGLASTGDGSSMMSNLSMFLFLKQS